MASSANKVTVGSVEPESFGQGVRIDGANATLVDTSTDRSNKGIVVNGANALLINTLSIFDGVVGIQVNQSATNFVMVGGGANAEHGIGIELNGVSGAVLNSTTTAINETFGLWLNGASGNLISNFTAQDNGIA